MTPRRVASRKAGRPWRGQLAPFTLAATSPLSPQPHVLMQKRRTGAPSADVQTIPQTSATIERPDARMSSAPSMFLGIPSVFTRSQPVPIGRTPRTGGAPPQPRASSGLQAPPWTSGRTAGPCPSNSPIRPFTTS